MSGNCANAEKHSFLKMQLLITVFSAEPLSHSRADLSKPGTGDCTCLRTHIARELRPDVRRYGLGSGERIF